jgi:lipid II:glycine glycyltransferase (peptidoglycan interpeptide bridge formation enzyme)
MQTTSHIVQSQEWAEVKAAYGTPMVRCGELFYSKHHIPLSPYFVAYCPKVNPFVIDWDRLTKSLTDENCVSINFDVPNIVKGTPQAKNAETLFQDRCSKSPKETFASSTVMLDLTKTESELLANLHPKHRYNMRLAQKNGVVVHQATTLADFDTFFELLYATAVRQKYYIHPKHYYQTVWEVLSPRGMCHMLTAKYNTEPLSSWMLFNHQGVLYYPYGGSSDKLHNLFPSNLLGWEAIKFGKELGCTSFDMWGACKDITDQTDPWWGFTNFKLKFGGTLTEFMTSYDLIVNTNIYKLFNLANTLRWKMLKLIR